MVGRARRLLMYVAVLPLLIAALTACSVVTPIPGNAPNPSAPPALGTATEITETINGVAYVGLQGWSALLLDGRLERPLFILYTQLPAFRPIAQASASRGTTYGVDYLNRNIGGIFFSETGKRGRVVINATILNEPTDVQVAVLAHELWHSQSVRAQGAAACVSEEMHAMAWEASAYTTIIRPDPSETDWTRGEEARAALWRQNRLQESVLLDADYQRECLGGVVQ